MQIHLQPSRTAAGETEFYKMQFSVVEGQVLSPHSPLKAVVFVGLRELCVLCEGDVRAVNLFASEAADPLTHRSLTDTLTPEGETAAGWGGTLSENQALLSFYL